MINDYIQSIHIRFKLTLIREVCPLDIYSVIVRNVHSHFCWKVALEHQDYASHIVSLLPIYFALRCFSDTQFVEICVSGKTIFQPKRTDPERSRLIRD